MKTLQDYQEYRDALAAMQRVRQRRTDNEQRIQEIHRKASAWNAGDSRRERLYDAAVAVVENRTATIEAPPALETELQDCYRERVVLDEADQLAGDRLAAARIAASRQYAGEIRTKYSDLVKRLAKTLRQLRELCREEYGFRDAADRAGFEAFDVGILRAMPFLGAGTDGMANTDRIDTWLDEAKEYYRC